MAEEGTLWIVVAGAENAVAKARPLLEPLSRGISVVGTEPRQAHAVKLGGNFLISAMIHSLSEAFVYAEAQGIEPEMFLEAVNSALFQSPFYAAYGKVMLHPPETPGATSSWARRICACCARPPPAADTQLEPGRYAGRGFRRGAARRAGPQEDWAVGQYRMAQNAQFGAGT